MSDGMLLRQNADGTWGRYEPYTTIVVETEEDFKQLQERLELAERTQWIPCSERLPKKDMWCWATFQSGGVDKIQYLATNNFGWNGEAGDNRVIAWMPLPEPYKGGING